MKKTVLLLMSLLVLSIAALSIYKIKNRNKREFDIYQSYSFVNGGYDDTTINVIVYIKGYQLDEMFAKVKAFHNNMNGMPDKLTINLYDGKKAFENDILRSTRTYLKVDEINKNNENKPINTPSKISILIHKKV